MLKKKPLIISLILIVSIILVWLFINGEKPINKEALRLYFVGSKYYYENEYNNAIKCLHQSLSVDDNYNFTYYLLGLSYLNLNEYTNSLNYFYKCNKKSFKYYPYVNYYISLANYYLSDYRKAIKHIEITLKKNKRQVFLNHAGISYFRYALKIKKENTHTTKSIKYFNKAQKYFFINYSKNSNSAYLNNNIGWAYLELNKFDRAIKYFNKAIKINPKNSNQLNNLGNSFERKGRHIEYINNAPNNISLSNYLEARKYYKKCLLINPKHSKAFENSKIIEGKLKKSYNITNFK